jgi:hypothetical protein
MYRITPELRTVALRVRFLTPVSHHDAARADSSNRNLFNRQKQVVKREVANIAHGLRQLLDLYTVPEAHAPLFEALTETEFLATALVYEFMSAYATADGIGLFSGAERYRRLEERAAQWSVRASSVFQWWSGLARELQVGLPLYGDGERQAALLGMSPVVALSVLRTLSENATSAVMLARVWREAARDNQAMVRVKPQSVTYPSADTMVADVPALSANSIRHEMVREPGALHLLNALGLRFEDLPAPVATMLYNAGDLNTTAPDTAFRLAREIRERYPLLGLLGGATSGFLLGASNLEVSAWLIGTENAEALARYGIEPQRSVFDLLDSAEHTRHTQKRVEGSPMPFGFETLAAGAEALVEFRLRPYATDMELGALIAALATYAGADGTLFGQSARGYGLVTTQWLAVPESADEACAMYEQYLAEHADELRDGLLRATLGTERIVLG